MHVVYIPHSAGEGVAPVPGSGRLPPRIRQGIATVVELDCRRRRYLASRSWMGLYKLAADYRRTRQPMLETALEVESEARELHYGRPTTTCNGSGQAK